MFARIPTVLTYTETHIGNGKTIARTISHNGLLPKYGKLFRNIKGSQLWVDVDVHVDVVDDADADDVPSNLMVNQC